MSGSCEIGDPAKKKKASKPQNLPDKSN